MTKNDWYETGEQIKNLVQDAVDTGDFSQLGNTISNVVNDAMDGLQDALRGNLGGRGDRRSGYGSGYDSAGSGYDGSYGSDHGAYGASDGAYNSTNGDYDQTYRGTTDRTRRAYEQAYGQTGQTKNQSSQTYNRRYQPPAVRRKVPGEFGSKAMKYLGFGLGAMFGGVMALEAMAGAMIGDAFLLMSGTFTTGIFCAGSLLLGAAGQKRLGLSRRFRRYQEVIGERTYCKIEELASGIGGTTKYVAKDLKNMIRRGYFPVGYLDRKETLLITDQSTYQQYLQAEEEYERRQREQAASGTAGYGAAGKTEANGSGAAGMHGSEAGSADPSTSRNSTAQRSAEHQALIDEGKRYILHIHECNEKIPGEEITAKLTRLELVVTRIFREAEKDPDAVTDLRKMMSYYLPTTQKLLDAYCELDAQPAEGKNMAETKKEIESALDTINTAFENLLDSLYEEQAWDISSDISVLNSMLAQEGLTGNGFTRSTAEKASGTQDSRKNDSGREGKTSS
ncbi:MAG: 5-bromo-4-chloroindolyl phosphate hydrolysis family protein [Clostridiales bacterium]|nr:5-bromo-4-chloroindolyl phosphate hydrolysis family protein [Clostridiales bacterium]